MVIVHADDIKLPEHLPAYTCLANQLYIPVHAELYPPVSSTELQKILLWQVQFFHPTIGLVGFEKKDRLNIADLITITEPVNQSWYFAHPDSNYFGVGKINNDQLHDYAARMGMKLEDATRWLRPILE